MRCTARTPTCSIPYQRYGRARLCCAPRLVIIFIFCWHLMTSYFLGKCTNLNLVPRKKIWYWTLHMYIFYSGGRIASDWCLLAFWIPFKPTLTACITQVILCDGVAEHYFFYFRYQILVWYRKRLTKSRSIYGKGERKTAPGSSTGGTVIVVSLDLKYI